MFIRRRLARRALGVAAAGIVLLALARTSSAEEPPRVIAALEQGEMAEQGRGGPRQPQLALSLYCDAGVLGSAEGYFRVGRLLREPGATRNPGLANAYLALAARLGHQRAQALHDPAQPNTALPEDCSGFVPVVAARAPAFDIDALVAAMPAYKRKIAKLIHRHAPNFGIDGRFALAIALTESNLDHLAVSPQNAQGVMQLSPVTLERYGVTQPFDPDSNIRGALAYLRWLAKRYDNDWKLVAAAYNAGEGAIEKYRGLPPFAETRQFVRRVLFLSGQSGSVTG